MSNPQYIGPYSAEYYDQLYPDQALFTHTWQSYKPQQVNNSNYTPSSAKARIYSGPRGCVDLWVFVAVVALLAFILYSLYKMRS